MRSTVTAREYVTGDAVLLTLHLTRPGPVPPGSHLDVAVALGDRTERRSYSLVDLGHRDGLFRICVRRRDAGRGGSTYMHTLSVGDIIETSEPIDGFPLSPGDAPTLLVAGGIGVTPLTGIASALRALGVDYQLHCVVPDRSRLPMADHLAALHGDRLSVHETGVLGRPVLADLIAGLPDSGRLYICGPFGLHQDAQAAWRAAERPPANFRCETFGDSGLLPATAFEVRVRGRADPVPVPANRTMLDALTDAGVAVLSDCRRGECGLCAVDVLDFDGSLDHRDLFLSAAQHAAARRICACVSRVADGSITIDTGYRERASS